MKCCAALTGHLEKGYPDRAMQLHPTSKAMEEIPSQFKIKSV